MFLELRYDLLLVEAGEVELRGDVTHDEGVEVIVVEAGDHGLAAQINVFGIPRRPGQHIRMGADGGDPVTRDEDRLGFRELVVDRDYPCVAEDRACHGWKATCAGTAGQGEERVGLNRPTALPAGRAGAPRRRLELFRTGPSERRPPMPLPTTFTPEVEAARHDGAPLVALESTIISHGMPYPQNIETAREVEETVRAAGAVPATLAIIRGEVCVGLTETQLEHMGRAEGVMKASRRDLAVAFSEGLSAATTVAATMILAAGAGIPLFATGGIGGVHRGAEQSFDISADLQELARTPVAVVSAGPKALLDLRLTAEYLETMGVPVIGVGTDELPAFYSRESGINVDHRLDTPQQIARFLKTGWETETLSGTVLANPVPPEWSLPKPEMDTIIDRALGEAEEQGIHGKELTPFLLTRITELSEGKSLVSNIALVKHNADLAARIAVAMSEV